MAVTIANMNKLNQELALKLNAGVVVALASNFHAMEPALTTRRCSHSARKIVSVSQSNPTAA
jgi:hypothetical protein